jgi:hypothetical protein
MRNLKKKMRATNNNRLTLDKLHSISLISCSLKSAGRRISSCEARAMTNVTGSDSAFAGDGLAFCCNRESKVSLY